MPIKQKFLVLIGGAWCTGCIGSALLWKNSPAQDSIYLLVLCVWTGLCFGFAILAKKTFLDRLEYAKKTISALDSENPPKLPREPDEFDYLVHDSRAQLDALRETSRQHRQLIEHAVDVICLIDAQGNFLRLSPSVKSVWGYAPDKMIGHHLSEFIPAQGNNMASMNGILGAERSVDSVSMESPFRRADGRTIHLAWSVHWSASDNGLFCVTRDITARVLAEQRLRESEERTRLIVESLPLSVLFVNASGYIEMANSMAVSALEYPDEELCGRHLSLILPGHLKEFDSRDLHTQLAECKSASVTRKSGEKFPADISLKQLVVDKEEKSLIVLQDVSERYAMEMLKRQFMAMITHDIRAPLSSVRLLLELFGSGKSSEKLHQLAKRAVGEVDRLSALTTDLMDFETANQGKFSLYFSEITISSVMEAAFHAVSQLAESQGISIELNNCDASCEADHRRLVQVLVNLLTNAIKYSPRGQKVIVTASKENGQITVSVKDQGRGVPAEKAKIIFDPYSQAEKVDATTGTGLGLAICKGIVEQHGGTIGVDSSADSGSKFWFSIPERQVASQN